MSYLTARAAAFEAELNTWPSTMTFRGVAYQVVASTRLQQLSMQLTNYKAGATGSIDMRNADYSTAGIQQRNSVDYNGTEFTVLGINTDPNEPFTRLTVERKQGMNTGS